MGYLELLDKKATRTEMAAVLNKDISGVSRIMKGKHYLTLPEAQLLAKYYKIPAKAFFE
jgi:antitoxin component HigA of HigAB toxin-antitoxin module